MVFCYQPYQEMDIPLVQVLTDTEAQAVAYLANQRVRSSACTIQESLRRNDVRWVTSRVCHYLEGSADPPTARRVLASLASLPLPELTKVKLLNARARTEIGAFLAEPDMPLEAAEVAEVIDAAWAAAPAAAAQAGSASGGGSAAAAEAQAAPKGGRK